jgi:hypothetical protein
MSPGPTRSKREGKQCEKDGDESRPAAQSQSRPGNRDPGQSDEDEAQAAKPKRDSTELGTRVQYPPYASSDRARLCEIDQDIRCPLVTEPSRRAPSQ